MKFNLLEDLLKREDGITMGVRRGASITTLSLLLVTFLVLLSPLQLSKAFAVLVLTPDDILDEFGKSLRRGNFKGLLHDGKDYYYLTNEGVFSSSGSLVADLRNAEQVGPNYVLAQNKVFKVLDGKAISVGNVPPGMKSVVAKADHVIGIDRGQLVCYYAGNIVWSMVTPVESIKLSGDYLAAFGGQTQLFNLSNIKFPKLERFYPKYSDYAFFSGMHAFSDGSRIYLFKGATRQGNTFVYRGPLQSDGKNLYSGNTIIGPDLVQRDLAFSVRLVVTTGREQRFVATGLTQEQRPSFTGETQREEQRPPVQPVQEETFPTPQRVFNVLWRVVLNDELMGKPAVKGKTAYLATLKGNVIAVSQGKVLWTYKIGFVVMGHVTVGKNVYAVSWDDTVYAIGEDGTLRWKLKLDADISQGPAWDGFYLYVATDSGTVYTIRDMGSSGVIQTSHKTGTMPSVPPAVSLSGKIFVVDGVGNLWRDRSVIDQAGKVRNTPVVSESVEVSAQLGFTLVDENGTSYRVVPLERETQIMHGKSVFMTFNEEIVDAVIGKRFLYVLTQSGRLHVIERVSKRVLFTDTVQKAKFLSVSEGCLFVFGREVVCYNVGDDVPSGLWNSMYANQMNWNSAMR